MAYGQISPNLFIVGAGKDANYPTIAAATAAAPAGTTIYIQDGTYTEDIITKNQVSYASLSSVSTNLYTPESGLGDPSNITIAGKIYDNGVPCSCFFSGLSILASADNAVSITGDQSCFAFSNCNIDTSASSPTIYINGGGDELVYLSNCSINSDFNSSKYMFYDIPAGNLTVIGCWVDQSQHLPTHGVDTVTIADSYLFSPVNVTHGGELIVSNCYFDTSMHNLVAISCTFVSVSSGNCFIYNTHIHSGSASGIFADVASTVFVANCSIISTNTNAISGTGTIQYGGLSFPIGGGSNSTQVASGLTLKLAGSTPANATSGKIWTSTGTNTSPTWQSPAASVTSIAGTANEITSSASTGAVTLSIPSTFIAPGSIQATTSIAADTGDIGLLILSGDTITTQDFNPLNLNASSGSIFFNTNTGWFNGSVGVLFNNSNAGNYTLSWPGSSPTTNYLLGYNGSNNLAWYNIAAGTGISVSPSGSTITVATAASATSFFAYLNTSVSNVTGDSTAYTIVFESTVSNVGSAYNTGTGVFTAPATGVYQFNCRVTMTGIGAGHAAGFIHFNYNAGTNFVGGCGANPHAEAAAGTLGWSAGVTFPMTSGDTMSVELAVGGSTKTVGVEGYDVSTPAYITSFNGFRVS